MCLEKADHSHMMIYPASCVMEMVESSMGSLKVMVRTCSWHANEDSSLSGCDDQAAHDVPRDVSRCALGWRHGAVFAGERISAWAF